MKPQNIPDPLFSAAITPAGADSQSLSLVLKTCQFHYLITYMDEAREHYLLVYEARIGALKSSAVVTTSARQQNAAADNTPRAACLWRYRGYLIRRLAMLNRAGEQFESTGFGRSIEISNSGGDHAASWATWRERLCDQWPASPASDFEPAVTPLNASFEHLAVGDKHRMANYFRHGLGLVKQVSEIE